MTGGWRIFRPEDGAKWGGYALAYAALYVFFLGFTVWSIACFDVVIFWPINGVLLAACLQLPRRYSLLLLLAGGALNLTVSLSLGSAHLSDWTNPLLDMAQVLIAMVLTRRLCGANLDMRHPRRMVTFALGAALPAVAITTLMNVGLIASPVNHGWQTHAFMLRHFFLMEYLGLVIITPCLLLLDKPLLTLQTKTSEGLVLLALLGLIVTWVFSQPQPILFLIFIPLMIMAYRLSPPWVGAGLILTAMISSVMTLHGLGPVREAQVHAVEALVWVPQLMHQAPLYFSFMLAATAMALPISALITDRRRLVARLARRTRKAHQQSLLAHEAVTAKSRFLAMMSHEMRTPLNAIQGFSEVLALRDDLEPAARQQVAAIAESSEALKVLIEDLLETSEGDDGVSLTLCDLEHEMRQAIAEEGARALSKGLGLRLDLDPLKGRKALCDIRRLRAALRHLVSNAVKFSQRGEISLSAYCEGDGLVLRVQDQGVGIAPESIPRLFEVFFQEDDTTARLYGGAGIGLPVARHHARAMGGDVSLVSTSNAGSIFEMTAKVQWQADEALIDQGPLAASALEALRRVLIVDDVALNRSVMRVMIEGAGYEVEEAADGAAAVAKVTQSPFAAVLMDLRMPVMDGYEASRLIRQALLPNQVPALIAVTADSSAELMARIVEAGLDCHLPKPFTRDSLLACLRQAMGEEAGLRV